MEALRRIQAKLQGVEIVGPERVLLCEGTLLRVRARSDPKDYLFFLFNDALIYAEPGQYKMNRKFDIGGASSGATGRIVAPKQSEGGRFIQVRDRPGMMGGGLGWEVLTSSKSFSVRDRPGMVGGDLGWEVLTSSKSYHQSDDNHVRDRPGMVGGDLGWEVLTSSKSFSVVAQTLQDKERWLRAMQRALEAAGASGASEEAAERAKKRLLVNARVTGHADAEARRSVVTALRVSFNSQRCNCLKCGTIL
ncbi:hypothetical protein T484DRAFT_1832840 [Baffinella frigidus]|nr:hypothetical protein T484DRAFT_1832840 [Cryptophyta sp. CCMP2293]